MKGDNKAVSWLPLPSSAFLQKGKYGSTEMGFYKSNRIHSAPPLALKSVINSSRNMARHRNPPPVQHSFAKLDINDLNIPDLWAEAVLLLSLLLLLALTLSKSPVY